MTLAIAPPSTGAVFAPFEVRDSDTAGGFTRLAGVAVPYNTRADIGMFTEEFSPGAFAKSIRQAARGLPLLLFHNDRGWPVGVSESWKDTRAGLEGVWRLDAGEEAQRAGRMARDGSLGYLSIRFQQVPGAFRLDNTGDKAHFIRSEARLLETSLTSTPAYVDSAVTWVRSQPAGERHARHREWSNYLEDIRNGPATMSPS